MTISSEYIEYQADGTTMKGYMAYPASGEPAPCIMVVHEWWGQTDYPRKRADMLAEQGYTAFAVDMYGDGKVAADRDEAGSLMTDLLSTEGLVAKRFNAAYELLQTNPHVLTGKIAAIGYCLGGKIVLDMARAGLNLAGVVSFHGVLETAVRAKPGEVKAKVRVFHGNDDVMVTLDQADELQAEMEAAGVDYKFVGYDNATHGFTNTVADINAKKYDVPIGYDAKADADSWNQTLAFFKEIF